MKKRYLIIFIFLILFNVNNVYAEGKTSLLVQENNQRSEIININCIPGDPSCKDKPNSGSSNSNQDNAIRDHNKPGNGGTESNNNSGSSSNNRKDPTDPSRKDTHEEGAPSGPKTNTPGAAGQQQKDEDTVKNNRNEEEPFHCINQEDCDKVNDKLHGDSDGAGTADDIIKKDEGFLNYATCESLFGDKGGKDLLDLLQTIVNLIRISIPLLLLALGVVDFSKAVFAGSEEDMKKTQKKFIKRLIIGICIFLVPTFLRLVLNVGNQVWGDLISPDFCGILQF